MTALKQNIKFENNDITKEFSYIIKQIEEIFNDKTTDKTITIKDKDDITHTIKVNKHGFITEYSKE